MAVRRPISIFGFPPLCLVDRFLRDPRSWGRFNTNLSSPTGRALGAWYTLEVVWALTGTYTDKSGRIVSQNGKINNFFHQHSPPGKLKFSSSAASDLQISHRLLH